jgi:hypothetical protein
MNLDYLDDFCLEEEFENFADYLASVATREQMEAFLESSRRVQSRYMEFVAKCEEDIASSGDYEVDEEAV